MVMMVFQGGAYNKPLSDEINAARGMGDNLPPDPCAAFSLHLDDLEETARQYLDGKPIETEAQAEDVSRILSMARKAGLDADDARKAEKRPHDEAAKAVQERWKPILAKADLITMTAKKVLAPYLQRQEDEQRAAAAAAAQEARELAEAAAQTAREANPDSLYNQTALRQRQEAAAEAARAAARLDKAKPQARGGERAVGLRSVWTPTLVKPIDALKHYMATQPEPLKAWLLDQAQRDVRAGKRSIPGFEITEQKVAV